MPTWTSFLSKFLILKTYEHVCKHFSLNSAPCRMNFIVQFSSWIGEVNFSDCNKSSVWLESNESVDLLIHFEKFRLSNFYVWIQPYLPEWVDHQLKVSYCWMQLLWNAEILPNKKIFWKKDCFTPDLNLWPLKLYCTDLPIDQVESHEGMEWICHLTDLDWVDDQLPNGKSVGKYLMVIRVKVWFIYLFQKGFPATNVSSSSIFHNDKGFFLPHQSFIHIFRIFLQVIVSNATIYTAGLLTRVQKYSKVRNNQR